MTKEKLSEAAFSLLRHAVGQEGEGVDMEAAEWWQLFRLMQQNHVGALCFEAAAASGCPREVRIPWAAEMEKAREWFAYQKRVQEDIVQRMQKHGVETLVLKGTRTARHYPDPTLREFGDLDLYFYRQHTEADHIARKEMGASPSADGHHHTKYTYRGVTVESHSSLLNGHYPPSSRRLEKHLLGMESQPTFELLYLLRHMSIHFAASRMTLRDLADWAFSFRSLGPAASLDELRAATEEYGMQPFAAVLNEVCAQRLGLSLPSLGGEPAERERIEEDMLFGSALAESTADGTARLLFKLRRWNAMRWKRRLVFSETEARLAAASLGSHLKKPLSLLHKM